MITVQNDRIRVTVTQAIWEQIILQAEKQAHTQTLPSGEQRQHTCEQVARGLLLSRTMSNMENPQFLQFVNAGIPTAEELLQQAKMLLMCDHLSKHGQFSTHDCLHHFQKSLAMPADMERDVMEAEAFADAQLAGFDNDDAKAELYRAMLESMTSTQDVIDKKRAISDVFQERQHHFFTKLMNIKALHLTEESAATMSQVATMMFYIPQGEQSDDVSHTFLSGWKVDLIGELPDSITLPAYTCRSAA